MKDVLETLERWAADGAARRDRDRRRDRALGSARSRRRARGVREGRRGRLRDGRLRRARRLRRGPGGARRRRRRGSMTYGIADEEAFEVGLPCGGTVHIFVDRARPGARRPDRRGGPRGAARSPSRSGSRATTPARSGSSRPDDDGPAAELLARGETGIVDTPEGADLRLVLRAPARTCTSSAPSTTPRRSPRSAATSATASRSATRGRSSSRRERFPDVDELVVEWPDKFLASAPVDERTVDLRPHPRPQVRRPGAQGRARDDRPATSARWAPGARTRARNERLRAEGVSDEDIARIHAPIGLKIGSRTPEEVAVAIAAQIVAGHALAQAQGHRRCSLVKLENSFEVAAPPEKAWDLLMDVPRIVPCMPGREARRGRRRRPLEGDDGR